MLDAPAPANDHDTAGQLAATAGEMLLDLRGRRTADGVTGKPLGHEGDQVAHRFLVDSLARLRPDDAVLSEESYADEATDGAPARPGAGRVWIVDPLDGTREFGEPPRTDWAVHVALVVDGRADIGAVALPGRGLTLVTDPAPPRPVAVDRPPRIVVSRSRPPAEAERIADALVGELVPLGSAGAKAMAVVLGEADVYAHAGGQYEWDSAAPVAVARAAGLHTSRLDGSPLTYNHPDPYLPDLLICRPELADRVIAAAR